MIELTINGKNIKAKDGATILEAASACGIKIPTLCWYAPQGLKPSCRICVVEIISQSKLVTACSTKVAEGMSILTNSDKVKRSRKTSLELLYASHFGKCATCAKLANCELLKLVVKYGAVSPRFKGKIKEISIDESGIIYRELTKCIKCRRCVFACKTFGTDIIHVQGQGIDTMVTTKGNIPLNRAGCSKCRQCARVCPVAALVLKEELAKNKK